MQTLLAILQYLAFVNIGIEDESKKYPLPLVQTWHIESLADLEKECKNPFVYMINAEDYPVISCDNFKRLIVVVSHSDNVVFLPRIN